MNQELLNLRPIRFLCPYCGEWHKWELSHELDFYDSSSCKAELGCESQAANCNHRKMHIYFSDGYCYYRTIPTCSRGNLDINDKIPIEDIVESSEESRVTFAVPFTANRDVGRRSCIDCPTKNVCLMYKLGDKSNSRHMHITFGFEFKQYDYNKYAKTAILARKEKELQEREDAIVSKEQVSQRSHVKENKEDTTMANNLFNMNMEFGPIKDENIASTLMGFAVKNGDSWRIYDKKKKEIIDVGDMPLDSNLPITIWPATTLREGDLIKDGGEYCFVTEIATPNTPTKTLIVRTAEIKSVAPIKNILGFSCYSKVIALGDLLNMSDEFDVEKLAIISAMGNQTDENNGQLNQLLPLLFYKDKLVGDDDKMNLLLISSMMNTQKNDGGQLNQFLPFLLYKDKLSGDDDKTKLLLISTMMGSNMSGSNNPVINYLMLDTLMSKEDSKDSQTDNGAVK